MNVIDLCDSDDDETDSRDTEKKHQRLHINNQNSQSPSSTAAPAVAVAVAQRPRSISSASNSPLGNNSDDVVFLSDDESDDEQQEVNNLVHQRRTTFSKKKPTDKPMSAREKSWALIQQMRREAAKEKEKSKALSSTASTKAARGPQKKSPPITKVNPRWNDKRKRKRSNSNLEHRKKAPTASSTNPTSSTSTANINDNAAPRIIPSFLEQGLKDGTTNQQGSGGENVATASLLSPLQTAMEVHDSFEQPFIDDSMNATSQDNPAAHCQMETITEPTASAGATMNAAIEIDSDGDSVVDRSPQEDTTRCATNSSVAATATDYHPLLQLASARPPAEQRHGGDDNQGSQTFRAPRAQDNSKILNDLMDSGSVAHILDHRFNNGKVTFVVKDHYGAVHKGILLEDLKVDAPLLLSNYILNKARGKLAGKGFREWAVKTRNQLAKKAMRHIATQERVMAGEMNDGLPEPDTGTNQPGAKSVGRSSHVPISTHDDADDAEEAEFEMNAPSSCSTQSFERISPNLPPVPDDPETRDDQIQTEDSPEQSIGPIATPNVQEEGSISDMSSGNDDFEDTLDTESSSGSLQMTSQGGTSENDKTSMQIGQTKTSVPDLDEELLLEQEDDSSIQTEPRTSEDPLVGSRPAYTAAEVAVEIDEEEEDDDDVIEVVGVKAPPRIENLSPPTPQHRTSPLAKEMPLDTDDDSVCSVQSASPPRSSSTRKPLVGSSGTPIDIDDDHGVIPMGKKMDTTLCTMRDFCAAGKRKNGTKRPVPTSYSYPERRFVFHQTLPKRPPPSARRPTASTWAYGISCDAAMKEQERLFQASAAKMRSQTKAPTTARVTTTTSVARNQIVKFQQVVPNIAQKYPLHWQFSNHFARLGVPEGSSGSVIKKQYRRLALIYHPDKSQLANTATKFQNITEAYRALLNL
ncbi:unnamed protein product [Cylindrotheca closterium]|uniref:J domain-containing protein n=1 Tax=Cylindrotheca closterium TaxID=2856 RepID=A0AAD2G3Y3_9STRA|nr:unnamed protein product [Cylindrotheca closterium]